MPLVVPALRLAMLFLNIYESYKMLKPPPPSSRNAHQPSLRAVTQRKRNMKGCLAVWIVWCCYIVYERLLESLVGIFIPFYDEVKSLVIMFFILTRARGAEPIYLHIIRPFLKPYTEMLDSILDFTFLILDIILATMSAPVKGARILWNRTFGRGDDQSDDDEMPIETSNGHVIAEELFHETSGAGSRIPNGIHRTCSERLTRSDPQKIGQPIPVFTRTASTPTNARTHEIWHPPPSAYQDDEDDHSVLRPEHQRTSTSDSDVTLIQEVEVDEWRQYPPFPAAYPPTPLVSMMHLSAKTASFESNGSSNIAEVSKQDFRLSLSPLSEDVDPASDGDLSDRHRKRGGVHTELDEAMSVDNDAESTMGEEEEDEFNVTLQTPLPTHKFAQPFPQPFPMSSRTTSVATSSMHSRSAGLTTAYNGSSLRTKSSLDSLASSVVSDDEAPRIGRKRPLPVSRNNSSRNTKSITDPGLDSGMKRDDSGDETHRNPHAPSILASNSQKYRNDGTNVSELKKRKLGSPKRSVRTSRPARPRLARGVSPPAKSQRRLLPDQGRVLPQRREHAGSALSTNKPVAVSTNRGASATSTMSKSRPGGQERKLNETS